MTHPNREAKRALVTTLVDGLFTNGQREQFLEAVRLYHQRQRPAPPRAEKG